MNRFRLTSRAERDVDEIWLYIARDNTQAADRLMGSFLDRFQMLADRTRLGRQRDELNAGLRSFVVGNYVVLYRPIKNGIEDVRVLSGYRDIDALFGA